MFGGKKNEIQYLDLALDSDAGNILPITPPGALPSTLSPTVYKTVDFLKTEAFNRTREKVEQERKGKPILWRSLISSYLLLFTVSESVILIVVLLWNSCRVSLVKGH